MRGYSPEKQRTRWGDSTISQVPGTQSRGIKEPPTSRKPPGGRLSTGAWGAPCSTLRHRWWQLRAKLFIGRTRMISSTTHFGKVTRPDGVMLQLGQRSSERDVWLWVPTGTGHNQISPWSSPLTLSHWRECNELHFISSLPPGGLQLVSGSANFIRHFPPMSAVGARQHPQQGPLLSGSSGGGGGVGGGGGETRGGATRPATGLLWPRGI
jgi:hypothetical protein